MNTITKRIQLISLTASLELVAELIGHIGYQCQSLIDDDSYKTSCDANIQTTVEFKSLSREVKALLKEAKATNPELKKLAKEITKDIEAVCNSIIAVVKMSYIIALNQIDNGEIMNEYYKVIFDIRTNWRNGVAKLMTQLESEQVESVVYVAPAMPANGFTDEVSCIDTVNIDCNH